MDEVIQSRIHYQPHTGVVTHERTQPSENLILHRNAELRKNKGVIRDLGAQSSGGTWGRQVANIPNNMFETAIRNGYGLNCTDQEIAQKELFRYLQSEEGKKCLTQ